MSSKAKLFDISEEEGQKLTASLHADLAAMLDRAIETSRTMAYEGTRGFPTILEILALVPNIEAGEKPTVQQLTAYMPDLPSDKRLRHQVLRDVGKHFAAEGKFPLIAIFVSEGWGLEEKSFDAMKTTLGKEVNISEHPDREEMLMIAGMSSDGKEMGITMRMTREDSGNVVLSDKEKVSESQECYLLHEFFDGVREGVGQKLEEMLKRVSGTEEQTTPLDNVWFSKWEKNAAQGKVM